MYCPNCGAEKQKRGQYCSECGKPIKAKGSRTTFIISLMALLIALTGTGLGVFFFLNKEEPVPVQVTQAEREPEMESETEPEPEPKIEIVEKEVESEKAEEVVKEAPTPPKTKSKTEIIKAAQDKVFTIFTDSSQGSGFLFSNQGDIVTNAHVVAGYTDVLVRSSDGAEFQGQVIGISDVVDIALIRVRPLAGKEPLPVEMEQTAVGTEVIALGSPRGLENTASIGFLTGVDRDIMGEFNYEKVYQIDAQISPGSSGGPLLDGTTGKVIGINSAVLIEDQSIGFSIPMFSVHSRFTQWSQNPMSAEEVSSLFGFYEDYYDYWEWNEEDWEYNEDDYYDWEKEEEHEEEDGSDSNENEEAGTDEKYDEFGDTTENPEDPDVEEEVVREGPVEESQY